MSRQRSRVLALCFSALLALSVSTVATAAPTAAYSASMTSDGSCLLTVTATWKNTKIDHVFVGWYLDDQFIATGEAPGIGGSLRAKAATLKFGPATASDTAHTWRGLVQFYSGGAFMAELNPTLSVNCALG